MKKLFVLFFLILGLQSFSEQLVNFSIVPTPKLIEILEGEFQLRNNLNISDTAFEVENEFTIELIQQTLKKYLNINSSLDKNGKIKISSIGIDGENHIIKNLSDEGYVLRIQENQIELRAKSPKGIYYAAMSLIQMLEKADRTLQCVEIIDWPDLEFRGISDDISRGQVSNLDNFKKIISHIARYKMNTYMPYLEDMLVFEKYPTIGKGRGALTKEEVKEIVSFAKKNFVDVIPIFQTLGHYENILSNEEFLKFAEFPGAASLNVSNDSTYIFLEELLKEVFELFPSEYFHMGADESYDVGLHASKELVDESNIASVHANHYKKVYDICKKYNKKVMMYGDILLDHPEILSLIPNDIIVVDWHYRSEENYTSTKLLHDAGFAYFVSPSAWNFLTTFPTNVNSLPNIKNLTKSGLENGSIGMINSNWGDYGAETFKELILYNYAWSAQCSWDYTQSDLDVFNQNYFYDFFGIDDERLSEIYETLSNPLNQVMWHEIWRHPFLTLKEPPWWEPRISKTGKISWNKMTLPKVEREISALKSNVKKNSDHFELLEFIVHLTKWYDLKLETQFHLQNIVKEGKPEIDFETKDMIDKNLTSLTLLKQDFRKLWLRYYKEANLTMIEDKFDRLCDYFNEIKESMTSQNILKFNPLISSNWIYLKTDDSTYASKAEFEITFELNTVPNIAYIQLLGDTYIQLFINGTYVDQVFSRRSLSLYAEYKRIKLLNVNRFLSPGTNSIKIVAENFNRKGAAGFNLISNIETSEGVALKSDDSDTSKFKWIGTETGSNVWKTVTSKSYPFEIIAPNFESDRTSWIER